MLTGAPIVLSLAFRLENTFIWQGSEKSCQPQLEPVYTSTEMIDSISFDGYEF